MLLPLVWAHYSVEVSDSAAEVVLTQVYRNTSPETRAGRFVADSATWVFTEEVRDLAPGEDLVVTFRFSRPVTRVGRTHELTLPLTVVPALVAFDGELRPPRSGAAPEVEVEVAIDSGAPLVHIESPSHPGTRILTDETGAAARVTGGGTFRLRWTEDDTEQIAANVRDCRRDVVDDGGRGE